MEPMMCPLVGGDGSHAFASSVPGTVCACGERRQPRTLNIGRLLTNAQVYHRPVTFRGWKIRQSNAARHYIRETSRDQHSPGKKDG